MHIEQLVDLIKQHYPFCAKLSPLGGEHENNFKLEDRQGHAYVLKLFTQHTPFDSIDFQVKALQHIKQYDAALPVPGVVQPPSASTAIVRLQDVRLDSGEAALFAVLLDYLEGVPLAKNTPDASRLTAIGGVLGKVDRALAGFAHPASDYALLWDMKRAHQLLDLTAYIKDDTTRFVATRVLKHHEATVAPVYARLPWQVIHNDFNPYNVLFADSNCHTLSGIIDFGDMIFAPRVIDLAVACAYYLGAPPKLASIAPLVAAFDRYNALQTEEKHVLFDLILTRLAMGVTISQWRAHKRPQNKAYLLRNYAATQSALLSLSSLASEQAQAVMNSFYLLS